MQSVKYIRNNKVSELQEPLGHELSCTAEKVEEGEELGVDGRENRHYVQERIETEWEEQVHRTARPIEYFAPDVEGVVPVIGQQVRVLVLEEPDR